MKTPKKFWSNEKLNIEENEIICKVEFFWKNGNYWKYIEIFEKVMDFFTQII